MITKISKSTLLELLTDRFGPTGQSCREAVSAAVQDQFSAGSQSSAITATNFKTKYELALERGYIIDGLEEVLGRLQAPDTNSVYIVAVQGQVSDFVLTLNSGLTEVLGIIRVSHSPRAW